MCQDERVSAIGVDCVWTSRIYERVRTDTYVRSQVWGTLTLRLWIMLIGGLESLHQPVRYTSEGSRSINLGLDAGSSGLNVLDICSRRLCVGVESLFSYS